MPGNTASEAVVRGICITDSSLRNLPVGEHSCERSVDKFLRFSRGKLISTTCLRTLRIGDSPTGGQLPWLRPQHVSSLEVLSLREFGIPYYMASWGGDAILESTRVLLGKAPNGV